MKNLKREYDISIEERDCSYCVGYGNKGLFHSSSITLTGRLRNFYDADGLSYTTIRLVSLHIDEIEKKNIDMNPEEYLRQSRKNLGKVECDGKFIHMFINLPRADMQHLLHLVDTCSDENKLIVSTEIVEIGNGFSDEEYIESFNFFGKHNVKARSRLES